MNEIARNIQPADQADARAAARAAPLDSRFTPASRDRFAGDTMWPWFERLRAEAPVHYSELGEFEPHWSITRYKDIVAVDTNHKQF